MTVDERLTSVDGHHDVTINYVGHAESWDRIDVAGDVKDRPR